MWPLGRTSSLSGAFWCLPLGWHAPASYAAPSLLVVVLVVAAAPGVCALAASVMAPVALGGVAAWVLAGGGLVVLLGSLIASWLIQRRRDRTLW